MCAQWKVTFGSDSGPVNYLMAEPRGPALLDVVLICDAHFGFKDLARMSALLRARGIRCFASTLTPDEGAPVPPLSKPKVPLGEPDSRNLDNGLPYQDKNVPLAEFLSRILDEQSHRAMALVVIGQPAQAVLDDPGEFLSPGRDAIPLGNLQIAALTETRDEQWRAHLEAMADRFFFTETQSLDIDIVLNWLEAGALPWLLRES